MNDVIFSFEDWKKKLIKESEHKKTCVLVEGKKDLQKLSFYGVHNVIALQGKKYYDVIEYILTNFDKCIVLFDIDKHGEKMAQKFSKMLSAEGINVNNAYRDYLKTLNIEEIENLP